MTIYVVDGLEEQMLLELSPYATLGDVKKKVAEKGRGGRGGSDSNKYIHNGKVLIDSRRLVDQGVRTGSKLYPIRHAAN